MPIKDMWMLVKGEDKNWGIEGYEVPREYYDYHKVKYQEELDAKMKGKIKRQWPPKDWKLDPETEKPIPPKRPNYLDQIIKWANSYYNPTKAEEIKEAMADKGHPIDAKPEPKKAANLREKFKESVKEKVVLKERLTEIPEYKIGAIESVKEKIKQFEDENKNKTPIKKMKDKYKSFGSLPRCDRVTIVADSEHLGEKYPFYNTYKSKTQDEDEAPKKGKNKLFYPDVILV